MLVHLMKHVAINLGAEGKDDIFGDELTDIQKATEYLDNLKG